MSVCLFEAALCTNLSSLTTTKNGVQFLGGFLTVPEDYLNKDLELFCTGSIKVEAENNFRSYCPYPPKQQEL